MTRGPLGFAALLSLAACLAMPLCYFWGVIDMVAYKRGLLLASLAWFVFATAALARRPGKTR